jgi:5-dehydro-2-deoxygluconokinase
MTYDLITVGRVNMDLFSQEVGAEFADIPGFDTAIGGSPSNIAVATSRLGLKSIAFTAVGDDRVGDFVLRYLRDDGVITDFIPRKPGKLTSLALLGVQPPDRFPLAFYRDDPADIHLTVDDAALLPITQTRAVLLSGNAFSRGTCVEAARSVAEAAGAAGLTVFMDLDLRPTDWSHPRAFGLTLRTVSPFVDVLIGTEEEFFALLGPEPEPAMSGAALDTEANALLETLIAGLMQAGTVKTIVLKRGARGAEVIGDGTRLEVPGFPVEVVNTVGAGDAFASGLIWSRLQGWDWYQSSRLANACGALVVTRHGCAAAFPRYEEVTDFAESKGGL